jgi:hypothetical protein
MKKGSTLFLKGVVIFLGLLVVALCVFGLPAAINYDQTGYYRPILFGMYLTVIPFFIALYETMKLLGYIDNGQAFSILSVRVLKKIKYCAIAISVMYAVSLPYIYYAAKRDDAPWVVMLGLVFTFAPIVIAVFAAVLQRLLKDALDIKSENDLTV